MSNVGGTVRLRIFILMWRERGGARRGQGGEKGGRERRFRRCWCRKSVTDDSWCKYDRWSMSTFPCNAPATGKSSKQVHSRNHYLREEMNISIISLLRVHIENNALRMTSDPLAYYNFSSETEEHRAHIKYGLFIYSQWHVICHSWFSHDDPNCNLETKQSFWIQLKFPVAINQTNGWVPRQHPVQWVRQIELFQTSGFQQESSEGHFG